MYAPNLKGCINKCNLSYLRTNCRFIPLLALESQARFQAQDKKQSSHYEAKDSTLATPVRRDSNSNGSSTAQPQKSMYVHINICVCVRAYIITHTYISLYIYMYLRKYTYIRTCIYIYMYLYGGRTAGNVRTPPQPPASGPGRPCGSMAFVGSWELQAREIEIAWSVRTFQGG